MKLHIFGPLSLAAALLSGPASAEPRAVSADEVLAMMLDAEPNAAASPYRASYGETADAIAMVATVAPLFEGQDGPARTAAIFVSLQWFESNGNVGAEGDCTKKDDRGRCLIDKATRANIGDPQSFGLYQVGRGNFASLGVTREEMTTNPITQTLAARRMIKISFSICRGRSDDDLLGQYASGGSTCAGTVKSAHRMRKAKWLFDRSKERAKATPAS